MFRGDDDNLGLPSGGVSIDISFVVDIGGVTLTAQCCRLFPLLVVGGGVPTLELHASSSPSSEIIFLFRETFPRVVPFVIIDS